MDKAMEVRTVFVRYWMLLVLHAHVRTHILKPWILPVADLCVACPLLDPSARFVYCCILRGNTPTDLTTIAPGPLCTKPCSQGASDILVRPSNWRDFGQLCLFLLVDCALHSRVVTFLTCGRGNSVPRSETDAKVLPRHCCHTSTSKRKLYCWCRTQPPLSSGYAVSNVDLSVG